MVRAEIPIEKLPEIEAVLLFPLGQLDVEIRSQFRP